MHDSLAHEPWGETLPFCIPLCNVICLDLRLPLSCLVLFPLLPSPASLCPVTGVIVTAASQAERIGRMDKGGGQRSFVPAPDDIVMGVSSAKDIPSRLEAMLITSHSYCYYDRIVRKHIFVCLQIFAYALRPGCVNPSGL